MNQDLRRLRAAVYGPQGQVLAIVTGVAATVQANTPPGGSWRELGPDVWRLQDVPPISPSSPLP